MQGSISFLETRLVSYHHPVKYKLINNYNNNHFHTSIMSFDSSDGMESRPSTSTYTPTAQCRKLELHEILLATENFSESFVIGKGGFGKVYKGEVIVGNSHFAAAIKRLDFMSDQGAAEFWAEVEMLSKLRHCHLVSLIGYCNYETEMILVYEYMLNGTLEDHLYRFRTHLSWVDRLKICIGAARGLDYLHTGTGIDFGIIHRDVKSSNILLHESWSAQISDFGLSRIGPTNQPRTYVNTLVKGTFGYLDPNYFATGKLTRKSDVYAFGVVLFEVLCQKRPVDRSLEYGLAAWAQDSIKEGNLKNIVHPDIRGEISPKCLKEFARIAERCLEYHPKHRPTMTEVIFSLESVLTLQLQTPGKSIFTRIVDVFPFNSTPNSTSENSVAVSDPTFTTVGGSSDSGGTVTSSDEHVPPCGEIVTPNLKSFTFSELRSATRNFRPDTMLGEGCSGRVFKGWVDRETYASSKLGTGIAVAVKQLNLESAQGRREWLAEVKFLGKFSHPNLVKLVGYCSEDREFLLVYEFMQKGSLENHLFTSTKPLAWSTRIKIATGAARGLAFLHTTEKPVIYGDFKLQNILLDNEFNAKLSDFGLTRLGASMGVVGTCYMAPEYITTGQLYVKSDVYGFGGVLLEIITGLRVFDTNRPESQVNLVNWARELLPDKRKLTKIIDSQVHIPVKAACRTAKLILNCLEPDPKKRPSMEEVLVSLQEIGSINSKPNVQSTGVHGDRRYQSPLHTRKGVAKKLLEEEAEKKFVMWKGVKTRLEVNTLDGFKTFMGMLKHAPTAMKYKDLLKTKIQDLVKWFHKEYMNCVFDAPIPPKIGIAEVCLFDLFELVESLGGSEKISEKYQWDMVAMSFGFPACMKNKLRGIFERYLELLNSFYRTVMEEEMTAMEVGRAVDAQKGIHTVGNIDHIDDVDGRKNEFGEEGCEEGRKETREKHMYEEAEAEDQELFDYDHVNIVSDDGERLVITFEQKDVSSKEPSIEEYSNSEGEEDSAILDSDSD